MRVELRHVTKRFNKLRALDDVNIVIEPGQVVALLGSNGAGKTTLLRCLAGILGPDRGEILYDDLVFVRGQIEQRKRFFVLPDFPAVFEDWTVLRYISLTLRLYEKTTDAHGDRVVELLTEFDMLPSAELPFQMLSRGQRYKAALIALIAVDAELWLIDEPFASGMDPHGLRLFKRYAGEAAARGSTILYTTQILEVVESFSDRICVLHKGRVRAFDAMENLTDADEGGAEALHEIFQELRTEIAE